MRRVMACATFPMIFTAVVFARSGVASATEPATARPARAVVLEQRPEDPISEVVVTGSRASEVPFLAGQSVDVIGARAVGQRQPRTDPALLKESPGLLVQETNLRRRLADRSWDGRTAGPDPY